jgi:hypothetical protein
MSSVPQIVTTPKVLKFTSDEGGVGVLTLDGASMLNGNILSTTQTKQYFVSFVSGNLSNRIYNICEALGNNKFVINGMTFIIPDGYYTIGPFPNGSSDIFATLSTITDEATHTVNLTSLIFIGITLSSATLYLFTNNTITVAPYIFGLQKYINTGTATGYLATTSFGFKNTLNVAFNTMVEFPLQNKAIKSSDINNPIAPVAATYNTGATILSQNGFGAYAPIDYDVYGRSPVGEYYSPGIVIASTPIPYEYQEMPIQAYQGPVFTINAPQIFFPIGKPQTSMNFFTVTLCDDYGNIYYFDGRMDLLLELSSI